MGKVDIFTHAYSRSGVFAHDVNEDIDSVLIHTHVCSFKARVSKRRSTAVIDRALVPRVPGFQMDWLKVIAIASSRLN